MARRVFLHIGLPKTGTTFLQTMMWHNRAALADQGFLYPGIRRMDHYRAWQEINGIPEEGRNFRTGVWDALREEIDAWSGDALISHEFFSLASPAQARQVVADLGDTPIHLVVTVRSYVLQFPAVWQEALKMGSGLSFDEFMAEILAEDRAERLRTGAWSWRTQDIPRILRLWTKNLPADRVSVITVPPPGAPRGLLWDRWCTALGVDDSGFDTHVPTANESIGGPQAALLERLVPRLSGPLLEGQVRHKWFRGYFAHRVLVPQQGARFGMRPEHVEALRAPTRQAIRYIRGQGFAVFGQLSELRLSEPVGSTHPEDISDPELLDTALDAIERLIRDHREAVEERESLRRENGRLRTEIELQRSRGPIGLARRAARRLRRPSAPPAGDNDTASPESETP